MLYNTKEIITILKADGVIAYPTETVYGFGCAPFSEKAIERINNIKQRKSKAGFILVAGKIELLLPYVDASLRIDQNRLASYWPCATTLIFPAAKNTPEYLLGPNNTVALRLSTHPIVRDITTKLDSVIISTSINISGQPPLQFFEEIYLSFNQLVDIIVPGIICLGAKPSKIVDFVTGEKIR